SAVKKLSSDDVKERERASVDLLLLGPRVYPALLNAQASADAEAKIRLRNIIARMKDAFPGELLEVRESDVISTKDGKISGKLDGSALRVKSPFFGDMDLRFADIESLRTAAEDEKKKDPEKRKPDIDKQPEIPR